MRKALLLALCVLLVAVPACQTTKTYDENGNLISETKSFEITQEHIAAAEAFYALAIDGINAYIQLKGEIDDAEFEEELAKKQAKAEELKAKIDALKALLEALPKPVTN